MTARPFGAGHHGAMDERNDFQRRIGVGERARFVARHHGTTRHIPVLRDEGKRAGTVGGYLTEHWSGRIDATPQPPTVRLTASLKQED